MKKIRSLRRSLSLLLAVLILNVSIDMPDEILHVSSAHSERVFNEIESIAEFVMEECLDKGDLFPETDGDDGDGNARTKKGTEWKSTFSLISAPRTNILLLIKWFPLSTVCLPPHHTADIPYPPPRIA